MTADESIRRSRSHRFAGVSTRSGRNDHHGERTNPRRHAIGKHTICVKHGHSAIRSPDATSGRGRTQAVTTHFYQKSGLPPTVVRRGGPWMCIFPTVTPHRLRPLKTVQSNSRHLWKRHPLTWIIHGPRLPQILSRQVAAGVTPARRRLRGRCDKIGLPAGWFLRKQLPKSEFSTLCCITSSFSDLYNVFSKDHA